VEVNGCGKHSRLLKYSYIYWCKCFIVNAPHEISQIRKRTIGSKTTPMNVDRTQKAGAFAAVQAVTA
jgi:hypothetical protein